MNSLMQALGTRAVGAVESVTANEISVLVDPDAPQAVAFNAGAPVSFPRINGYLIIPNEVGATVGWIASVRVVRAPFPKRTGMRDFGLIDLPFPSRMVTLTPLGTLVRRSGIEAELPFEVRRGVDVFPSAGDPVLLPTSEQLRAIVEGEGGVESRRILIGRSPIAAGAPVYIDPDRLFGRHLAILGNTGAGKSCSVAGLIRWSLENARESRKEAEQSGDPDARFIVLDPNGEYSRSFSGLDIRLFQVEPTTEIAEPLEVPAWLWNGEEWAAFTDASPGVQRPVLLEAIRRLKSGVVHPDPFINKVRGRVSRYRNQLKVIVSSGEHMKQGKREGVADMLTKMSGDFDDLAQRAEDAQLKEYICHVAKLASKIEESTRSRPKQEGGHWHNNFAEKDMDAVSSSLDEVAKYIDLEDQRPTGDEDAPRYFPITDLPGYVDALASGSTARDLAQFVDSLKLRIHGLIRRHGLSSILAPGDGGSANLEQWLSRYIGTNKSSGSQITVVDLSLVPSEVVHIVVSVFARMIFEALQRYRRHTGRELPTVLVLEEAHGFVHRDLAAESAHAAARVCSRIFERIAREGRKFGLGLVLASQRPSEVSPTVLSQCNTFLLHRIVNDRDQELVRRLVPDGLGSFLRELPSLPSRRAVLLGWAAPAPVLVEVRELPEGLRPHSPDPSFWSVWTGASEPTSDNVWKRIADGWTNDGSEAHTTEEQGNSIGEKASSESDDNGADDDIPV